MPRGPIERSLTFAHNPTFTGQSKFADGTAAAPSITFASDTDTGWYRNGAGVISLSLDGVTRMTVDGGVGEQRLHSAATRTWSSGDPSAAGADLILARDAANTLALRNGVNGQAFRLYDSYTDESTHTGWELNADTAGSFLLRYRNNGTFSTVGTFQSDGRLTAAADVSGLLFQTTAANGYFGILSRLVLSSPADGAARISNNAGSNTYDITLADWGTTTSAESVSVAIDGTLFFGTAPVGTLFVTDVTGNTTGQFGIVGTRNATAEIYDSNGFFSATKDTAASLNVYYDAAGASGAGYYLQNKRGAINAVRLTLIGG